MKPKLTPKMKRIRARAISALHNRPNASLILHGKTCFHWFSIQFGRKKREKQDLHAHDRPSIFIQVVLILSHPVVVAWACPET